MRFESGFLLMVKSEATSVKDRQTGWSKGYAFLYFETVEQATRAKEEWHQKVVDGRQIRVDYSRTARPYSPTPGRYMGRVTNR